MKALISVHGEAYEFTHVLTRLVNHLANLQETVPPTSFGLDLLIPYAVPFRYDRAAPLTSDERIAIFATVETIRTFVIKRILAIEAANPPTP